MTKLDSNGIWTYEGETKQLVVFIFLVVILKTYDALTPFEKMLLKCASVLGDVFSRRMLLHLLQSDSARTVAQGSH